jgi:hypothetical protein
MRIILDYTDSPNRPVFIDEKGKVLFHPMEGIPAHCQENLHCLAQEMFRLGKLARDGSPDDIREAGWTVAVHNDYRLNGRAHTFWLFTKGDRCVKGEGFTDAEALDQIRHELNLDPVE